MGTQCKKTTNCLYRLARFHRKNDIGTEGLQTIYGFWIFIPFRNRYNNNNNVITFL